LKQCRTHYLTSPDTGKLVCASEVAKEQDDLYKNNRLRWFVLPSKHLASRKLTGPGERHSPETQWVKKNGSALHLRCGDPRAEARGCSVTGEMALRSADSAAIRALRAQHLRFRTCPAGHQPGMACPARKPRTPRARSSFAECKSLSLLSALPRGA
jgi:hypothetical protein